MSDDIRQLSAIMFSDIVGYTALMQADEKQAVEVIRHYNEVLHQAMSRCNGRVVNDYGDGNLCLFSSATDSMNAALYIQKELQTEPRVPLRIGLHLGETFFEGGKVFGDGVNIASRIQSFGQANTILFSRSIYDNIKNQTDFKSVSLGCFEFKNVSEPMEVLALVNDGLKVPVRKEMHGKGKPVIRYWRWPLITVLFIFISVISYLLLSRADEKPLLTGYQDDRVAVLPFENRTNDHRLDVFGSMTADWIIQALLNLDKVKVVTFQSVEDHLQYASISSSSVNQTSFADRTGADKIIKGSFYLQEDKILVQSQLLDARTGEVEIVLPEISGSKNDLQSLVKEISSRFAGYYESRGTINVKGITVPRYEAYIKFREVNQYWGKDVAMTRKILAEAIALDSSFYSPYGMSHAIYSNRRQWREADSVLRLIERKFNNPTPYQQDLINANRAKDSGNLSEMYAYYKKLYERDPKDIGINIWAAYGANSNWKYQEALSVFRSIDPSTVTYDVTWKAVWARAYVYCLIRLNQYEEARKIIQHIPPKYPLQISDPLVVIYIRTSQDDSLQVLLNGLSDNAEVSWGHLTNLYILAAANYALLHDSVNQVKWARLALERYKTRPKESAGSGVDPIINPKPNLSKALYLAGDFGNAAREAEAEMRWTETDWELMARSGCSYARLGQPGKVRAIISKIAAMKGPYFRGDDKYALAKIHAALGEKEEAVKMIAQAFAGGFGMDFNRYAEDADFIPLHGYGPYEDFVKPR